MCAFIEEIAKPLFEDEKFSPLASGDGFVQRFSLPDVVRTNYFEIKLAGRRKFSLQISSTNTLQGGKSQNKVLGKHFKALWRFPPFIKRENLAAPAAVRRCLTCFVFFTGNAGKFRFQGNDIALKMAAFQYFYPAVRKIAELNIIKQKSR